jgi:glycosyltransferase involved in cell wall biosynthesis
MSKTTNTKKGDTKKTTPNTNGVPFVSVICPTYNRHRFFPMMIYQFQYQQYPKDHMELIILDDSPEPYAEIDAFVRDDPRIRYVHYPEKCLIPKKRNMLNDLAKGDIIVAFDDDDFYPNTRVKHAVFKLKTSRALIAGSSELLIYDCKTKKGYKVGPYHANHGTNGTFAYKKELLKDHRYNENTDKNYAEEKEFLKGFTTAMVQLNPYDTIICFNHDCNTFDKTPVLGQENIVRPIKMDLRKLINDKMLYEFFMNLKGREKPQLVPGVQE